MATSQEKQEIVDALSGPRYYRIMLWGYGGESAYISLDKAQYTYWKERYDDDGDSEIIDYMLGVEDGEYDVSVIPQEADFLRSKTEDEVYWSTWYEAPTEIVHQYGVDIHNCRITIEEVDSNEYGCNVLSEIVDGEDTKDWISVVEEELNETRSKDFVDIVDYGCIDYQESDYMLQFLSSEKGTFFDGIIETVGNFDVSKLRIYTEEFFNGDDTVVNIEYNGTEVENNGGDTNGKGYSAHLWNNVTDDE